MKAINILIFIFFLQTEFFYASEEDSTDVEEYVEIFVNNFTDVPIYAQFFPVSAVFNGKILGNHFPRLSFLDQRTSALPRRYGGPSLRYLVGLDGYALTHRGPYEGFFEIPIGGDMLLDHNSSGSNLADAEFGYGIWKLALYYVENEIFYLINTNPIILDYRDMNYSYQAANGLAVDLEINVYNITGMNAIKYKWYGGPIYPCDEISFFNQNLPVSEQNIIKCYKQYHRFINGNWLTPEVTPNVGIYGISKSDELLYPIEGTNVSMVPSPYTIPYHENSGILYSPLHINYNHHAKIKCGKSLSVTYGNILKLLGTSSNNKATFSVGDQSNNQYCGAGFTLENGGVLELEQYSNFNVEAGSRLNLKYASIVRLGQNSTLICKPGSIFCNNGAVIQNSGTLLIQGTVMYCTCPYYTCQPSINRVEDSVKIIIEENASFQIPDSTTYIFKGTETSLICKDSSEVKFGKGSKLIFQDGARINANGCKFVSYDSTDVWDGIYFDGIAYDTLKNCTFQNAVNGINITDNYDPFGSPGAVEINNCTFKNSTSSDLLNYIYINNSYNVLIKDCNSEKTGSGGFTSGIIAEYCPTNGVVIADNNINYVTTGISLLQSSEYIGRNTITGSTNSGTGIYLDNSNGTIEITR